MHKLPKVRKKIVINKIKSIKNNKLVNNFSYLALISLFQKILPFITIPYVVSTIGVEKFGLITFAYAIMSYFQLIVDYGFNAIATKDISLHRDDVKQYSKIFISIIFSKLALFIFSLLILFSLLYLIDSLFVDRFIYIFSIGLILNTVLFPAWFFQGMEEMKYIAIFTVIGRIIYTISIFVFIQNESDYLLIPLLNSISLVVIAMGSFYFVIKKFNIIFALPQSEDIKHYIKEGWHLFISFITNNLYSTINTILLGSLTNYTAVGIYSLAETIVGAFIQLIGQFNQVIYPHLAKYSQDRTKLIAQTRKYLKYFLIVLISISISVIISADFLVSMLFGENNEQSVLILRVLAIFITLSCMGGFYTRYMIIASKQKKVLKITFLSMILNLILIVPAILLFQGLGVAITRVTVGLYQVYLNTKENRELKLWSKSQ